MNSPARILLIDKALDRKERINALKKQGYSVFPALNMEEARSRCMRGGYDLIVVHPNGEPEQAAHFCDEIRRQCPRQLLILLSEGETNRDYAATPDMASVVQTVESALNGNAKPADFAKAA